MVGDFMVCVDRIIASAACFDSGNGGGNGSGDGLVRRDQEEGSSESKMRENGAKFNGESLKKTKKKGEGLIECRICQEEGEESEMEAPCACNGTLKFAHRKCIQRWCYKKGDITCEICNQVYAPNYSAPPTRTSSDVIAIDIRQGWGARIDLHDSHFLAIAAAEQELLNAQYDEYAAAHNSGIACCRSVALIVCSKVDAASACSPCTHGYKGRWDGPRCIRLLQLIPSTCWFPSTMLFDSTFVLHPTKSAETTGLRFFRTLVHEKKRGELLAAQLPKFLVFDTLPELIY